MTHHQQNRVLARKDSHESQQGKGGKMQQQRERQDNRPAERRDPKAVRFSDVRLKLRNLDCQKVSNFEITVSIIAILFLADQFVF